MGNQMVLRELLSAYLKKRSRSGYYLEEVAKYSIKRIVMVFVNRKETECSIKKACDLITVLKCKTNQDARSLFRLVIYLLKQHKRSHPAKLQLMRSFSYNFYLHQGIKLVTVGMLDARVADLLLRTVPFSDLFPLFSTLANSGSESCQVLFMKIVTKCSAKDTGFLPLVGKIVVSCTHRMNPSVELLELALKYSLDENVPDIKMLINKIVKMKRENITGKLLKYLAKTNHEKAVDFVASAIEATTIYSGSKFLNILKNADETVGKILIETASRIPTLNMFECDFNLVCEVIAKLLKKGKIIVENNKENTAQMIPGLIYNQLGDKKAVKSDKMAYEDLIDDVLKDNKLFLSLQLAISENSAKVLENIPDLILFLSDAQRVKIIELAIHRNTTAALVHLAEFCNQELLFSKMIEQVEQDDPCVYQILGKIEHNWEDKHIQRVMGVALREPVVEKLKLLKEVITKKISKRILLNLVKQVIKMDIKTKYFVNEMVELVEKIVEITSITEVINLIPLNTKDETERRNTQSILLYLSDLHPPALFSVFIVDYSVETCRSMILRILAHLRTVQYVESIIPIITHAITDSNNQIRRKGFDAAQNIVQVTKNKELAMHLLHLTWYFILDSTVTEEFNNLLTEIVKVMGKHKIEEYLELGLIHPSKRVRKRYKELLFIASVWPFINN